MKKCYAAAVAASGFYWMGIKKCESHFPSQPVVDLPPLPGYRIVGYMGCPLRKVEEIRKRERLLFFADSIHIPQDYAVRRTSWWSRLIHNDQPVVLQLEIPEEADWKKEELWRDRQKDSPFISPIQPSISFWPAIPPAMQKKCDLQVRVHHVVTCEVFQRRGSFCRAVKALFSESHLKK